VVLVGGPGTGKTHLATALGVSGITRHSKRVRFYSTVDLVNALEQEKAQGKAGRIALSLLRMDAVILDELGYLPFSQAGGALLFHLLSKLYEHKRGDHDQPGLRRMVDGVRRRQDDDRLA
jgi:DNA replication protein DnaC